MPRSLIERREEATGAAQHDHTKDRTKFFFPHTYCPQKLPRSARHYWVLRRSLDHSAGRDESVPGTLRFFLVRQVYGPHHSTTPTAAPILGGTTRPPHPRFRIAVLRGQEGKHLFLSRAPGAPSPFQGPTLRRVARLRLSFSFPFRSPLQTPLFSFFGGLSSITLTLCPPHFGDPFVDPRRESRSGWVCHLSPPDLCLRKF